MAGEGGHRTYEYELDPAGNRLSVTDKDSKYIKFGLDPKYQLTNETQWSAKTPGTRNLQYAYVMDPNGNRLFQHKDGVVTSYTIGDNNEVTNISRIGAIDYDHYGSVVAYSDVTLTYDFERHMTHIEDESNHTDDHEYDGNGRRMRSKLNGSANWTHFIHDELTEQILAEYTLISSTFTIKSVNTYGVGLISTNRESTKRYFHFDGLGSTRALTDSSQVVQDTYDFSAYGVQESSSGSSVNPFRFIGQWGYYDDGARGSTFGLLLLGIRHYKPIWGRFLVWDPQTCLNRYPYSANQPNSKIDPTGSDQIDPFQQWQQGWNRQLDRILPKWQPAPQGIPPIYGNYCGPQSGDYAYSQIKVLFLDISIRPGPIDEVDSCCQQHDDCFANHKCTAMNQATSHECKACNIQLCKCLLTANCKGNPVCNIMRVVFAGTYACNMLFNV